MQAWQGGGVTADQGEDGGGFGGKADEDIAFGEQGGFRVEEHGVRWPIAADDGSAAHEHGGSAGGQATPAGDEGFAAQGGGIDAEEMGEFVGDAFEDVGGGDQAEHGFVDALGEAGGGAAGGEHGGGAIFLGQGVGAFDADHGGHVVGQAFAMDALRRRQGAIQLRPFGQEVRVGAKVVGNPFGVQNVAHKPGGYTGPCDNTTRFCNRE